MTLSISASVLCVLMLCELFDLWMCWMIFLCWLSFCPVSLCWVSCLIYSYAEFRYDACPCAECRNAPCFGKMSVRQMSTKHCFSQMSWPNDTVANQPLFLLAKFQAHRDVNWTLIWPNVSSQNVTVNSNINHTLFGPNVWWPNVRVIETASTHSLGQMSDYKMLGSIEISTTHCFGQKSVGQMSSS